MTKNVDTKRKPPESDMTPMVDVTFLLLIFFMVTASFVLQRSLDVPKPEPKEGRGEPEQQIADVIVEIDPFNTFHVLTESWEREAPSKHELLAALREARDGSTDGTVPNRVLVKAHEDSLHEKVVAALDSASIAGMQEVLLLTVAE